MEQKKSASSKVNTYFAAAVIPLTIIVSVILFIYVLGDASHFDKEGHPVPGDYFGIVYKGGFIVPILMSFFLMVITFSIERFLTITKAYGSGSIDAFVGRIKSMLASNDIAGAMAECDKQKGAVGNVVYSVLRKYKQMTTEPNMSKEQKLVSITKEIEESTALELPMLEKNLTIIATLASVATLFGLLGTVIGMIKAFAALATAGTPDASALANGISEALINTALGIATSAFAIIAYNFFTSKIDEVSYTIDEAGFTIAQNFSANYKEQAVY